MTSNVIIVNSIDRERNTSTFNYRFNFGTNSISGNLQKSFKNVKEFYIESIILPNIFIDIFSVHGCKKLGMLPSLNGDITTQNLSFPRISDLRYIVVNIEELNGNISGSHNINNKASAVFMFDTTIPKLSHSNRITTDYLDSSNIKMYMNSQFLNVGEGIMTNTNHDYIILKNISCEPTFVMKDMVSSINLNFFKPDGGKLTLMNDTLSIKTIGSTRISATSMSNLATASFTTETVLREGLYVDRTNSLVEDQNTYILNKVSTDYTLNRNLSGTITDNTFFESRKIEITCNEYFSSEEYKIGDTLVFKRVVSTNTELGSFLEKSDGHTIVGLRKESSTTTLYNIIEILPNITINTSTGVETENFFNLEGNNISVTGDIINRDNQNFVSINIKN